MVLGSGVASAAHALMKKVAAVSAEAPSPGAAAVVKQKIAPVDFIKSGPGEGNRIALTFDDGPTPGVTDLILDQLKERKIHATFFMIGERIAAAPDLARRVLAEGHEIGNHTFTHPKLDHLPDPQVDAEIQKTQDLIGELLDYRPVWFRPPCGAFRRDQAGIPGGKGLGIMFWSVDPGDWAQPGETKIVRTILAETKPGSIILCHDMHRQTADCVGPILDGLLKRDLSFVTVSTLFS